MKFSIITICYNSEQNIKKTIESVLLQDYKGDVEYFIIDGNSSDRTVEIAKSFVVPFQKKGYEYVVLSERDNGIYDAMNKGISHSTGDVIGIINSGDWYEPNALSIVSECFEHNHFDYFYADIRLIKKDGKEIIKHSKTDRIITSRHWNHPTSFVSKKIYDEIGAYRCKGIHDDFEFFLRVKKMGKNMIIRNIVLANFVTGGMSNKKGLKMCYRRIKDRYWCYAVNGYSFLYILECIATELAKQIVN